MRPTCPGIAGTGHQDAGSNVEPSTSLAPAAALQSSDPEMAIDSNKLHEMLRMMQDNPGMLQDMRAAVANMTPEQLEAAVCTLPILPLSTLKWAQYLVAVFLVFFAHTAVRHPSGLLPSISCLSGAEQDGPATRC